MIGLEYDFDCIAVVNACGKGYSMHGVSKEYSYWILSNFWSCDVDFVKKRPVDHCHNNVGEKS